MQHLPARTSCESVRLQISVKLFQIEIFSLQSAKESAFLAWLKATGFEFCITIKSIAAIRKRVEVSRCLTRAMSLRKEQFVLIMKINVFRNCFCYCIRFLLLRWIPQTSSLKIIRIGNHSHLFVSTQTLSLSLFDTKSLQFRSAALRHQNFPTAAHCVPVIGRL